MKILKVLFFLLLLSACKVADKPAEFNPEFPFLDYRLSLDERVGDLVSRLSLEEKVQQMMYNAPAIERLGIPAYNWWSECLHGVARNGLATVFPQAIGMAATFDAPLIQNISSAIGDEARAKFAISQSIGNYGIYAGLTFWTPNVNLFRDPRWGRGQETYGEDPYLTSQIGTAFVKGLQGDNPNYLKAAACAKHFVVHSGPEKDRHVFNAIASPKDMAESYLPAFKALNDAGVEGFMCAYNRTNSEACCGSSKLLTDLLRDEWGFKGYITSDCWALVDIHEGHKITANAVQSAALALKSGVNLNCGSVYYPYLIEAVKEGLVTEQEIDASLKALLKTRFRLGLFDPPSLNPYNKIGPEVIDSKEHRELAAKAARESMVLLKNNKVLPLSKTIRSLFVVGPSAATTEVLIGNYYGVNDNMVTFLEGIVSKVSPGTTVEYKQGFLLDREKVNPIDWSTGDASRADAIVVIAGISGLLEGEEGESISSPTLGDRLDYGLPDNQVNYIKLIRSRGDKPLILVLTGGSPVDVSEVENYVDAIVYAWYPGEEGGNAFADILFGNYNPSGRLPISFPVSLDQLPDYSNYAMAGRTYRYMNSDPYYPFGFGLSYTQFDYSGLSVEKNAIKEGEEVVVKVKLKNAGEVDGEEVSQLYLSYPEEFKDAPKMALKDFIRTSLKSGEEKTLEFHIPSDKFKLSDDAGNFVYHPGTYRIYVGGAAPMKRSEELIGSQIAFVEVVLQ
ncbi:MAG: glycoside hydrolase family 3 C-terminal domain-containing protein [Bacteroidales bacterium]|nr:glycoside hydrolase family 3 C-terminal domain-containing protein [Bacteroidales bacterium]MCB9000107.1 glycoside hydrolase family 3 C-terminal domain-containing protein [Bacteroidales bacterium]